MGGGRCVRVVDWGVFKIIESDCIAGMRTLPDASVQCCVTSPPYFGLRDYGHEAQIGLEAAPDAYVAKMVEVFREVRRVLRDDGTLWLNLGDSYAGTGKSGGGAQGKRWEECGMDTEGPRGGKWMPPPVGYKAKDLMGIPWRVAFALQADGWYLRQDIIWHKPNPMPESVRDRCTKAHEYVFLLSKSERYYFDSEAMKEEAVGQNLHDLTGPGYAAPGQAPNTGNRKALRTDIESRHRSQIKGGQSLQAEPDGRRNKRSVWTVATKPFRGAHFAVFPPSLIEPCILAGSRPGDVVLDPFGGSGTTAMVAALNGRVGLLTELNPEYVSLAEQRCATALFGEGALGS